MPAKGTLSFPIAEYPKADVGSRLDAIQNLSDRPDGFVESAVFLRSIEKLCCRVVRAAHASGAIQQQHDGAFAGVMLQQGWIGAHGDAGPWRRRRLHLDDIRQRIQVHLRFLFHRLTSINAGQLDSRDLRCGHSLGRLTFRFSQVRALQLNGNRSERFLLDEVVPGPVPLRGIEEL